jgi:pimeloyl-ACP methyl ester carboxylesterase
MDLVVQKKRVFAYTGGRTFDPRLPTVALIHGGEHDHSVWALQSRYMAHHGYGVLAVDLPGHGKSDGPALARIEDLAEWMVALLDAAGAKQATLVGHSMGSLAALDCAARFPERATGLALLGATFPMRVSQDLLNAAQRDEPLAQDMINIWSHAAYAHYPSNPGPGFWLPGGNLRLMQRARPGVLHTDFAACNEYKDGLARAAQIRCPALLLLGRRDQMTPARTARALAEAIPGARVINVEGGGHNLMGEKPDEVLDHLMEFLRATRAGAAAQSARTSKTG